MRTTSKRASERLVLVSDERELVERVAELLNATGVEAIVADTANREGLFNLTHDQWATGVLLVETITYYQPGGPALRAAPTARAERLRAAALRAARSPHVSAFGWVRSAEMADDLLASLRRGGTPFGGLTLGPLFELAGQRAAQRASRPSTALALIDALQAADADAAGSLALEQAAELIAAWVARGGMRGGDDVAAEAGGGALEAAVRCSGYQPLVLPRWRVRLNSRLGGLALAPNGSTWCLRGKARLSAALRAPEGGPTLGTRLGSWAAAWRPSSSPTPS